MKLIFRSTPFLIFTLLFFSSCTKEKPTPTTDTIVLKNGGKIQGAIQSETPEKIVLKYQDGLVDFRPDEIKEILRGQAKLKNETGIELANDSANTKNYPRLIMKTGARIYGDKIIKENGFFLLERTANQQKVVEKYPEKEVEGMYLWPEPDPAILDKAFLDERKKRAKDAFTMAPYFILSDVEASDFVLYRTALDRLFNDFMTHFYEVLEIEKHPVKGFAVKLYANQEEFLRPLGMGPESMILGYFVPKTRVLHLYNVRQVEMLSFWLGEREDIEGKIAKMKSQISQSNSDADSGKWQKYDQLEKIQFASEAQRAEVEFQARSQTIQTIRHEAGHQILNQFGIDSGDVHRGAWLSEGFAEYLGMEELGADNEMRLMDIRYDLEHGHQLIPLNGLMQIESGGGAHNVKDQFFSLLIYAESWAFVDFLMDRYKPQFLNYLIEIQKQQKGFTPADDVALLEKIVGKPLLELDKEFEPYIREMIKRIDDEKYLQYQSMKFKAAS